jgi:hypothetical protein
VAEVAETEGEAVAAAKAGRKPKGTAKLTASVKVTEGGTELVKANLEAWEKAKAMAMGRATAEARLSAAPGSALEGSQSRAEITAHADRFRSANRLGSAAIG